MPLHTPRRLIGRIAMLAVLLNALAPSLSQALVAARGMPAWVEVCTTQGARWVRPEAMLAAVAASPQDPLPALLHEACLYCLTHAASFGLEPQPSVWVQPAADVRHELPAVPAATVAHPGPSWSAPAVRAPPFPT